MELGWIPLYFAHIPAYQCHFFCAVRGQATIAENDAPSTRATAITHHLPCPEATSATVKCSFATEESPHKGVAHEDLLQRTSTHTHYLRSRETPARLADVCSVATATTYTSTSTPLSSFRRSKWFIPDRVFAGFCLVTHRHSPQEELELNRLSRRVVKCLVFSAVRRFFL